ncbi:MAG: hypothetical protein WBK37_04330 [Kiritimatiellia bacterium]|jgi:cell division septum initiation protein DivIVA
MSASAGNLTYNLGLNASGFTSAMRKAIGLVISYKAVMATLRQFGAAIRLGGELSDLADQTGETAGNVLVLKQAFQDAGLGVGTMQTALSMMSMSLSGISETGQRTEETFAALGLNMQELRGQSAIAQLDAIGKAISNLHSQEDKIAAARAIFGRGGTPMLTLFSDPNAIQTARDALGSMPDMVDKTAAGLDAIGDAWNRIKTSFTGAFVAAMAPAIPLIDSILKKIQSIDFTKIGAGFGAAMVAIKNVFSSISPMEFAINLAKVVLTALSAAVREAFSLLWNGDFWMGVGKLLIGALVGLGAALLDALSPVAAFLAAMALQFNDWIVAGLSKIPWLKDHYAGHQNKTFHEHYQSELQGQKDRFVNPALDTSAEMTTNGMADLGKALSAAGSGIADSVANSAGGKYFSGLFSSGMTEWEKAMADIMAAPAAQAKNQQARADAAPVLDDKQESANNGIQGALEPPSDRWSRVGAFVGGNTSAQHLDYARQTARSTSLIDRTAGRMLSALERLQPATL